MIAANYPLQALLYGVALHRFLRWRLPRYSPQRHLGGVLYLFVRGMCGPQTPTVEGVACGVFSWAPATGADHRPVDAAGPGCTVSEVLDIGDPRLAHAASGLLAAFNAAGVLDASDVHVAVRVGRLGGEQREEVLLAVALAVRAVRLGSVCVELAAVGHTVLGESDELLDVSALPWPEPSTWAAPCTSGPLVAEGAEAPGGRPLRLVDGLLYLERYWREEERVRLSLQERAAAAPPAVDLDVLRAGLDRHFTAEGAQQQRLAAAVGALRRVTVLAGGPGTGKTTTVARLLALLAEQPGQAPRSRWPHPTGKAAARLQEAVRGGAARRRCGAACRRPSTLHRLLGWRPGTGEFRHDSTSRLPFDVVVVDETSMVSLTMMARLLDAVRPSARIVLVGDPDQLASVEAGAVLGDLARAPGRPEPALDSALAALALPTGVVNGVVTLEHVWRFGGTIAAFARAVQAGDADTAVALLRRGADDLALVGPAALDEVRDDVVASGDALAAAALAGDAERALGALEGHRLLCAHRRGPFGVTRWTVEIERWLAAGRPPRGGPVVPGPAGARHRERLRHRAVQRRHRGRRRAPGRPAGGVRPRRRRRRSTRPRGSRRWPRCTR